MNKLGQPLMGPAVNATIRRVVNRETKELRLFASGIRRPVSQKPLPHLWGHPVSTLAPVQKAPESTEEAKLRRQATTIHLATQFRDLANRAHFQSPLPSPHLSDEESDNAFSDSESDNGSSSPSSPVQSASMQRFSQHQPLFFKRPDENEPPSLRSEQSSPIGSPLSSGTRYYSREDSPANAVRIHPEQSRRSAFSPVSRLNSGASTPDRPFDAYTQAEFRRERRQGGGTSPDFQHEGLSVEAVSPICGVSPTSIQDGIELHKRAVDTAAIIAECARRLMTRENPVFQLPQGVESGIAPRQALFESVQTLIAATKKLPTPPELNQAQQSHLTCVENFEKCLVRYKDGAGSDVAFLTLMRSTLGHLDQILDTHVTEGLEIKKETLADSASWTVYEVLQTKTIDTPLAIRPESESGQTAMHAILYGGKQEERASPIIETSGTRQPRSIASQELFKTVTDNFDISAHKTTYSPLPQSPAFRFSSTPVEAIEPHSDSHSPPMLSKPQFEEVCVIRFTADSFEAPTDLSSDTLANVITVIDTIGSKTAPLVQWIDRINEKLPSGQPKLAQDSPQWEAALKVVLPDESEEPKREHYRHLFFDRCKVKTEV